MFILHLKRSSPRLFNSSHLLIPFGVCHDTTNLILLTQHGHANQTLFDFLHKTSQFSSTSFISPLSLLDQTVDSAKALKLALDIGRGMAFLHGIANSFRPSFILNSHHIMVNIVTDDV